MEICGYLKGKKLERQNKELLSENDMENAIQIFDGPSERTVRRWAAKVDKVGGEYHVEEILKPQRAPRKK